MKRRAKKTEANKRKRTRSQSSPPVKSTPSLPLDLTSEIFLKLPAKSVLRFRCVSKLWSTITTQPYFTNTFETRSKLLLFFKNGDRLFVFSISQQNPNPNKSYSYYSSFPIDSYHMTYPKYCSFTSKTESVHGLICFRKASKLIIWNPTMRKFLALPTAEKSWRVGVAFFVGYDPVKCKHKVMCMPSDEASDECRVLTLGCKKSWRKIKTNYKHRPFCGVRMGVDDGQCINDVIYYQAVLGSDRAIMSFDVRSEKFSVIALPWEGFWQMRLIPYGRKLACVGSIGDNSMWVLEDGEKLEWSHHIFLPLSHYEQGFQYFKLKGITDDGELIYVQSTVYKSFPVIYIHPTRKTFRRVEYMGIADEEIRQRNGLGDRRLRGLQVFPNHIETLLSL